MPVAYVPLSTGSMRWLSIDWRWKAITRPDERQYSNLNNGSPPCRLSIDQRVLTHLPLDKMVAEDIFGCIFVNQKFYILIKISLNFVHKGPIDNNPALV